ncbi:MAG: alpha/beta fold hydrolase [bacterium]|nr:alpha/beta fold hydrolase [bacterium]
MTILRPHCTSLLALALLLALAGCGGGGNDQSPDPDEAPPAPHEQGAFSFATVSFETLRDDTRARDVRTTVYCPVGASGAPLVILSHGAGATRDSYVYLAEHLARHGFVVCVPAHAGSDLPGVQAVASAMGISVLQALGVVTRDPDEYSGRAGDVTFLIDQAATWNTSNQTLAGCIDTTRVAVIGHSYGAFTALVSGGATAGFPGGQMAIGDTRVDAVVAYSPQGLGGTGDFDATSFASTRVPAMLMAGSEDGGFQGQPPSWRREGYDLMPSGDKYFLSLANAAHLHFSEGFQTAPRTETHGIVTALTVAFLRVHLQSGDISYVSESYADGLAGTAIPDVVWSEK